VTEAHYTLAMYLHLARASELRRRWMVRDKLLLLCAQQAHALELDALAEHCRRRILAHNSGHLIGHFASLDDAVGDEQFLALATQAERTYSGEKAEHMLQSLGIVIGRAEATYGTPQEYLESILGPQPHFASDAATASTELVDSESATITLESPASTAGVAGEDWTEPQLPRLTEEEIRTRERSERTILWSSFALLSLVILTWGALVLRR
jgi:hypothetical protein